MLKECRVRKAFVVFWFYEGLERVYLLHREWHCWMRDVYIGTMRGGGGIVEDLTYFFKRVFCQSKVSEYACWCLNRLDLNVTLVLPLRC